MLWWSPSALATWSSSSRIAAASAPRTSPLGSSKARAAAAALAEVDFHRTWETCCRARFRAAVCHRGRQNSLTTYCRCAVQKQPTFDVLWPSAFLSFVRIL